MKKWLIASVLALNVFTINNISPTTAQASEKPANLSPNFVKSLKNGTLPRTKGKVGMTYKTFLKKGPIIKEKYNNQLQDLSTKTKLNDEDWYVFNKKINSSAKIISISRAYNYTISYESVTKNFGKPYKGVCKDIPYKQETNIYKAGKYYVSFYVAGAGSAKANSSYHDTTYVTIGTKKALMDDIYMGCSYKKLYR